MTNTSNYRWYILALAALTMSLTVAVPGMCLSVLFDEISNDLDLSRTQIGLIWGISALPGVLIALIGGSLGDRFGPKRILMLACLLSGAAGALRGTSVNFITLIATVFIFGLLAATVPMNAMKTCGIWFPRQQLGLANGVLSMGMALGFMTSSMISATVLSPWLGSWRYVLVFYGGLAMLLSIPWLFTRPAPVDHAALTTQRLSLRAMLTHVARIKRMWLLGWAILGIGGCIQATLGYLPLYLRDIGWVEARADSVAASFHLASMFLVIPLALWSDRMGSRRKVLLPAALMIITGIGLLSVVDGLLVWGAVITAGMVRDGFMAVFFTMTIETDGIGPMYAGTATGFVTIFSGIGSLIAPPIGNTLATITPSLPFVFWAGMAALGILGIYAAKESPAAVSVTGAAR
ncbi:MAG: MFS transporter [Anaerolineae bacterium]|nr:MFS transporter [Anaerolineae bacterium]